MRSEIVQAIRQGRSVLAQRQTIQNLSAHQLTMINAGRGLTMVLLAFLALLMGPNGLQGPFLGLVFQPLAWLAVSAFFLLSGFKVAGDLRLARDIFMRKHVVPSIAVLPCWVGACELVQTLPEGQVFEPFLRFVSPLVLLAAALPLFALATCWMRAVPVGLVLALAVASELSSQSQLNTTSLGCAGFGAYFMGARATRPLLAFVGLVWARPALANLGLVCLLAGLVLMTITPIPFVGGGYLANLPFVSFAMSLVGALVVLMLSQRLATTDFGGFVQVVGSHWVGLPFILMPALFGLSRGLDWITHFNAPVVYQTSMSFLWTIWG